MAKMRIGIIGTSGRTGEPLTKALFLKMCTKAQELIDDLCSRRKGRLRIVQRKTVTLVSGGAAWADHVAVALASRHRNVEIYFPCPWDGKHHDNGGTSWTTNPGRLANRCHQRFSEAVGWDTQADFKHLTNGDFKYGKGFHERNTHVAQVDYLIAFTQGDISGGTLDTWKKCKGHRIHVDLSKIDFDVQP